MECDNTDWLRCYFGYARIKESSTLGALCKTENVTDSPKIITCFANMYSDFL